MDRRRVWCRRYRRSLRKNNNFGANQERVHLSKRDVAEDRGLSAGMA